MSSPTHDVILVLGAALRPDGGASPALERRMGHGIRLYREGRARRLLVSGGAVAHVIPEASVMREMALQAGIPDTAVVVEDKAANTFENAVFSGLIMERNGWTRALLVTDSFHMPRALLVFRVLGISVTGAPCRERSGIFRLSWHAAWLREAAATMRSVYLFLIGRHHPVIAAARLRAAQDQNDHSG